MYLNFNYFNAFYNYAIIFILLSIICSKIIEKLAPPRHSRRSHFGFSPHGVKTLEYQLISADQKGFSQLY